MARARTDTSQPAAGRPTRRRRGFGSVLFFTLIFCALLWLLYWWGAREIASAALDRASAAATTKGYDVECTDAVGSGFPFSLDLACSRASLAGKTDPVSATLDGLSASAPLYRPGRVGWDSTGPFILEIPQSRLGLTATWTANQSRVDAGFSGLSAVATRIEGLRLHLRPEARPLPFAGASAEIAEFSFAPAAGDDYRLTASTKALSAESEEGEQLPAINFDADLAAVALGSSLGTDLRSTLRDWYARGGAVRIDRLQLAAGSVSTSTTGTLDMAPGGALSGTLKVAIIGIEALPDLVETFHSGTHDDVEQVTAVISAFSKPVETEAGPTRELQLTVRDNVISLGLIPIGYIPQLNF